VLSPVNEAVFPDAAMWTPVRDRLLGVLRRAAPRHTLMWGGHEWGSWRSLIQNTPPADPNTVAEVHDYEGGDTGAVEWRFGQVAAWRERHGQTVLVAELGGAVNHRENRAAWAADLRQSLPVLRRLRLPVALWAYTHGGHWRLQPGEGPALHSEFRAALES
jgi:Cellulase (glycosyl hydrolase family 5)